MNANYGTGLYKISDEEYFALPHVSNSSLGLIAKSPLNYAHYKQHGRAKTKSMELGSAVHAAILEPDEFTKRYVKAPNFDKRTNKGKQGFAEFVVANVGKTAIETDEWEKIHRMVDAVHSHKSAAWALSAGLAEHAALWTSDIDNTPCKAKIDFLNTREGVLTDLKTSENAGKEAFAKSVVNYGYHRQLGMYRDGVENAAPAYPVDQVVFVVVENAEPFHVSTFIASERMLKAGYEEYRFLLEKLARCRRTNHWGGFPEVFVELDLPDWYRKGA